MVEKENAEKKSTTRTLSKGKELYVDSIFANKVAPKNGKEPFIAFNATFRQRGDVNNNEKFAGAYVSKHTTPSGKTSHTQFISKSAVNKIFEANGAKAPSADEIKKAVETRHPIAFASGKHTGKGNDRNMVLKADIVSKNGFVMTDANSIQKSTAKPFDFATESKLNKAARSTYKAKTNTTATAKPVTKSAPAKPKADVQELEPFD